MNYHRNDHEADEDPNYVGRDYPVRTKWRGSKHQRGPQPIPLPVVSHDPFAERICRTQYMSMSKCLCGGDKPAKRLTCGACFQTAPRWIREKLNGVNLSAQSWHYEHAAAYLLKHARSRARTTESRAKNRAQRLIRNRILGEERAKAFAKAFSSPACKLERERRRALRQQQQQQPKNAQFVREYRTAKLREELREAQEKAAQEASRVQYEEARQAYLKSVKPPSFRRRNRYHPGPAQAPKSNPDPFHEHYWHPQPKKAFRAKRDQK